MTTLRSSRSPRERAAITIAAFVLVMAGVFLSVTQPMEKQRERTLAQIESARATIDYVNLAGQRAAALRTPTAEGLGIPTGETLMALLDRTATAAGIAATIKRIVPAGEHEASVAFKDIGFDELILWLALLETDFGITVTQLSANPSSSSGRTDVSVVLGSK